MRNQHPTRDSQNGLYLAVMLFALFGGLAAILVAAYSHGLWYDELFTLYVTRPGLDLGFALKNYWLADNHPPLYYFLSWVTNFLGNAIEPRRLVNLTGFIGACLVILQAWREDDVDRNILSLFVLGMLASYGFAGLAAELRSYFLSLLAPGLLAILLVVISPSRQDVGNRNQQRRMAVMLGLVSAVALNLHFITTIVSCALLGAFFLRAIIQKDHTAQRTIFVVGLIGIIPFLLFTALAFVNLEANTRSFWAEPGLRAGARIVAETAWRSAVEYLAARRTGCAHVRQSGLSPAAPPAARPARDRHDDALRSAWIVCRSPFRGPVDPPSHRRLLPGLRDRSCDLAVCHGCRKDFVADA